MLTVVTLRHAPRRSKNAGLCHRKGRLADVQVSYFCMPSCWADKIRVCWPSSPLTCCSNALQERAAVRGAAAARLQEGLAVGVGDLLRRGALVCAAAPSSSGVAWRARACSLRPPWSACGPPWVLRSGPTSTRPGAGAPLEASSSIAWTVAPPYHRTGTGMPGGISVLPGLLDPAYMITNTSGFPQGVSSVF